MSSDSPSPDSSPSPPSDNSSSNSSSPPKNNSPAPFSPPKNQSPPPSSPPPSSPPPSSPPPSPKNDSPSPPPPKQDDSSSQQSSPPPKNEQSPPATPATPSPPSNQGTPATPAGSTASPSPPKQSAPGVPAVHAPPPPPHSATKSPTSTAVTPPSDGSNSDKGVVIGVGIGTGVIVLLMAVICVLCVRRKRRKNDHMQYYGDPTKGGGAYYDSQQHTWNMSAAQGDHVVRLNQAAGNGGSGGAWPSPPPPMMSGEMSANFSGLHGPPLPPPSPNMSLGGFNKNTFTYEELANATNGFSQANLLGQGGFGYVHKGVLPSGKEVAVKSLKIGSGQGEREFAAEVEIISRVHHRHLVSLVGYCISGEHRLLVYEFVPNSTMEHHLHGKGLPAPMDWATRLRIATGSAKGLAYLHEDCHPKIIHRDIKSANILLDNNYEAMVADFGLAKLSSDNYTHVSTRVMGTFGYLAPEYASSGKLTEKSDVFSFGVMLLELITGKRPVDPSNAMEDSLVDWARPLLTRALEDGNYTELVDIGLDNTYNKEEMARMVACAAASIRHSAKRRPKMSQIVRALEGDVSLEDLNEGVKPGQTIMINPAAIGGGSDYDTQAYNADMNKFRKLALESQDSSEFGNSTDSSEMSTPAAQKPPRL
ncbi:hypothetical protein ACLB2K_008313 [Fragaria x ananassa]